MDLDLVFLGTSGSMPTAQRAPTAMLLRRGGERLLFDCAEGTQRQLLRSNVGLIELREIFLTHYHADHYLGLPGMLKTFALRGRELPITIYGPRGLHDLFSALRRIFGKLTYHYDLVELHPDERLALTRRPRHLGQLLLAGRPVDADQELAVGVGDGAQDDLDGRRTGRGVDGVSSSAGRRPAGRC